MRDRLARLFYGRNGIDKLSTFLWVVGLVLSFYRFRGGKWESMSVVKR